MNDINAESKLVCKLYENVDRDFYPRDVFSETAKSVRISDTEVVDAHVTDLTNYEVGCYLKDITEETLVKKI